MPTSVVHPVQPAGAPRVAGRDGGRSGTVAAVTSTRPAGHVDRSDQVRGAAR